MKPLRNVFSNKDCAYYQGGGDELQRGVKKRSLIDEERAVHEAYQILMTEYEYKRAQRDKVNRQKALEEEARQQEMMALASTLTISRGQNCMLVLIHSILSFRTWIS